MTKVEAIKSYIIAEIKKGHLKAGDKLPSIRKLANDFSCNKDTVQKALLDLRYEHYIHAIEKSGYYVFENPHQEVEALDLPDSEIANLAYEDFRLCLNETLIGRESYLFNYFHKQEGLPELIDAAHQLLLEGDVYSKREQLVITAGTQQTLYILTQLDFPNGKSDILLEQPTYDRMVDLVGQLSLPYQTISRKIDGIDFDELEAMFQKSSIKFFYLMPRLHNPLGTSYTPEEMERLVFLAEKYDVYLVEDDYMSDFAEKAPLHYYDTFERVIYLKSFSSTIFPALRLAVVCLPTCLKQAFIDYKKLMDYDTHLILQKALALYINNGMYAKNTHYLKERYHKQVEEGEALAAHKFTLPPHSIRYHHVLLDVSAFKKNKLTKLLRLSEPLSDFYVNPKAQRVVQVSSADRLEQMLDLIREDLP